MSLLIDTIYQSIQKNIISGQFKPMQRLHIVKLAAQYQVGPGPIREALSRLLSSQLVITINQCGFRVAPISRENLIDIYQTRAEIEAVTLRLSIEKGDDAWEAALISNHYRLAKYESEYDLQYVFHYDEWESRHRAFNLALLSACGLMNLLDIQNKLYHLTERYRRQWLFAGIKQAESIPYAKEQKKIMSAALARNAEQAVKLLHKHYENAIEVISAYFIKNRLFD